MSGPTGVGFVALWPQQQQYTGNTRQIYKYYRICERCDITNQWICSAGDTDK